MPQIQYKDPESEELISIEINAAMPIISIGRNPGNVIRVNNPSISRQHAKIVWEDGVCKLIDLDSSNGSYVNGQQIKNQILKKDDRIRVGEFPLDFLGDSLTPEIMQASLSHEDINVGDILSSADLDEALPEDVFNPPPAAASSPPVAPAGNAISFLDSDFSELGSVSLSEVSAIPPIIVSEAVDINSEQPALNVATAPSLDPAPDHASEPAFIVESAPRLGDVESNSVLQNGAMEVISQIDLDALPADAGDHASSASVLDFEMRIQELSTERDELLDLLQSRAGDAGGAAKVQIDRLRAERDRLIEERRGLQRSQRDLRSQLESYPPQNQMEAMAEELETLRSKDEHHDAILTGLKTDIETHLERIATLQEDAKIQQEKIEELENKLAESKNLQQDYDDASEQIRNFDKEKAELQERIESLLEDGASLSERDKGHSEKITALENQLAEKSNTIVELEKEREELRVISSHFEALKITHRETKDELESRPMAEEVKTIVSNLAAARAEIEANNDEISELKKIKHQLEEALVEAKEAESKFDARFNKQGEELEKFRQNFLTMKQEKEAFARETDYLLGAKRNFDSEIREAKKEVQVLQKADRRKKKIFDELRKDLEILIGENASLQQTLDALNTELENAPSAKDLQESALLAKDRMEEIAGLKLALSDTEDELEKQSALLLANNKKTEAISASLKDAEVELDALRQVVADDSKQSKQNDALSKTVRDQKKAVKELTKKLEISTNREAKLTKESKALTSENKSLKKEIGTFEKSNLALSEANAKKIETLEQQVADAEMALAEVIIEKDRLEDQLSSKS